MGIARPPIRVGEYEVTTLSNGTYRENCYLVVSALGDAVLIDPGGEPEFLVDAIEKRGVRPSKIVLTHGHFDHLGAVEALMSHFEIPCVVNELERRLVRQAATYAYRFDRGVPVRVPRNLTYAAELDRIAWGRSDLRVCSTPGHTTGSIALIVESAFVFTGDTLFYERIGPTTYPESEPDAIVASVGVLLDELPSSCIIFPGHGRPWTVGGAREWLGGLSGEIPKQEIF